VKKWVATTASIVAIGAAIWMLVAAGGSPGSPRPIRQAPPSPTPATVRLAIYADERLIADLTVPVCGNGASCPAYAFPPIPAGATRLSVGEVLLFRVSRRVPLVTVTAQAPMRGLTGSAMAGAPVRGLPDSATAQAPPAPAAPHHITLAQRRATTAVRVRLPVAAAGPQWIVLTLSYAAGTATVTLPVRIATP
jgi:hypothetical protein